MTAGSACNGGGFRASFRVCVGVAAVFVLASCDSRVDSIVVDERSHEAPTRPDDCTLVTAHDSLQRAVNNAVEGSALCLGPGNYKGPLEVTRKVTIWGPQQAVIHSSGYGTTIELGGDGAELLGVTIDGSGGRFDTLDAAVHVTADNNRVEGVVVRNAAFGLLWGVGGLAGPSLGGIAMDLWDPNGLPAVLFLACAGFVSVALYRLGRPRAA